MKLVLLLSVLGLVASCATSKPMMMPDGEMGFSISCDGGALKWDHCYEKAAEVCPKGYDRIDKSQEKNLTFTGSTLATSTSRNMMIKCKK